MAFPFFLGGLFLIYKRKHDWFVFRLFIYTENMPWIFTYFWVVDLYRAPETTPKLPDFPIALTAELYVLPPVDPAWESKCGYEARTSSLTVDVPSLLAKTNQDQKLLTSVDLHRQQPVSPSQPLSLVAPEPVQAW